MATKNNPLMCRIQKVNNGSDQKGLAKKKKEPKIS